MTREEIKELLPLLQAYAEGKAIQFKCYNMDDSFEWRDLKGNEEWDCYNTYRIKPTSKYRPFKDAEECWNEMLKHQPFGWVKDKRDNEIIMITSVCSRVCIIGKYTKDFKEVLDCYTFADGSVFGIKEEE